MQSLPVCIAMASRPSIMLPMVLCDILLRHSSRNLEPTSPTPTFLYPRPSASLQSPYFRNMITLFCFLDDSSLNQTFSVDIDEAFSIDILQLTWRQAKPTRMKIPIQSRRRSERSPTLSFHHHVILSASPNYVTFQQTQRKQTHDIKITAQSGLSKVSNRCQKISYCGVADDGPAGGGGVVEEAWRPRFVRIYQAGDRGLDGMCATASDRYLKKWEQH